ncbi:hypothetical protein D3C72_2375040 [compost metagenome]
MLDLADLVEALLAFVPVVHHGLEAERRGFHVGAHGAQVGEEVFAGFLEGLEH